MQVEDGHHRMSAFRELGYNQVPAIVVSKEQWDNLESKNGSAKAGAMIAEVLGDSATAYQSSYQGAMKPAEAQVRFMSELEGQTKPVPTQEELDAMKVGLPKHVSEIDVSKGRFGTTYKIDLFDENSNEAGFAYVSTGVDQPNILHVEATRLNDGYEGKGYGQALYREIAKLAQDIGASTLTSLRTSRRAANARSKILETKWEGEGSFADSNIPMGVRFMPAPADEEYHHAEGSFPKTETSQPYKMSAIHKISDDALMFADKMGGLAVPSVAVVKAGTGIQGFGNITLVGGRELVDPKTNPVYSGDAYTQRFPKPEYPKVKTKKAQQTIDLFKPAQSKFSSSYGDNVTDIIWDNAVNNPNPEEAVNKLKKSNVAKATYLGDAAPEPVMRTVSQDLGILDTAPMKEWMSKNSIQDVNYNDIEGRKVLGEAIRAGFDEIYPEELKGKANRIGSRFVSEDGQATVGAISRLEADVRNYGKTEIDAAETQKALDEKLTGKESDFYKWVENTIEGMYEAPRIRVAGKWEPYTLENITRVMTSGKIAGVEKSMTQTTGLTAAQMAKRFGSLQEMRNTAEAPWGIRPESEVNEARGQVSEVLRQYRDAMTPFYNGSTWDALDTSMSALGAYYRSGGGGEAKMKQTLSKLGFTNVPSNVVKQAVKAADAMSAAPVKYFEAKPQRVVGLNEFQGAIVPDNVDPGVLSVLQKNGIETRIIPSDKADDSAYVGSEIDKLKGGKQAQEQAGIRFMPERADAEHAAAYEAKDEERARGLVDEAAKSAGYNYKVYRGVENDYIKGDGYVFGKADQTYFTGNRELAETYANFMGRNPEGVVYDTYLRLENPYIPEDINDAANFEYNAKRLREKGYDGVIGSYGGVEGAKNGQVDVAVAFDPSQIKSADPFTYDDAGKLIPLSERFNTGTGDIRFMPEREEDRPTEGALSGVPKPFEGAQMRFMALSNEAQAELSPEEREQYNKLKPKKVSVVQMSKPDTKHDSLRVGTALLGTEANPVDTPQTSNISGAIVPDKLLAAQLEKMDYPHLPESILNEANPKMKRDKMVEFMKQNLKSLYDAFPEEYRARATQWYDGARRLADELSAQHADISPEQAAGILAVFSPQKDWFMNVAQGYQCADVYKNEQNTVITPKLAKKEIEEIINAAQAPVKQKIKAPKGKTETERQKTIRKNKNKALDQAAKDKRRKVLEQLYDKKLSDLSDGTKEGDVLEAWGIRVLAQIKFGRRYKNIAPEGDLLGNARNKKGDKELTNTWGSTGEIRKAVSIMKDGSLKNISDKLGDEHKVRNFYNNIIAPNTPFGDATIDTHAVAAAHLMPYGSSADAVSDNFGGAGKSAPLGISGSYHIYMDAYQQLAKELGILPRQLQSITWEAIRELYPSEVRSPKAVKEAVQIWKQNNENDARQYILRNGVSAPVWARATNN